MAALGLSWLYCSAVALRDVSLEMAPWRRAGSWESEAQLSLPMLLFPRGFFSDWFCLLHFTLWQGVVEWVAAATGTGPCRPCSPCRSCEAQGPESPATGESIICSFGILCPCCWAPHPQRVGSDSQVEGRPSCCHFSAGPSWQLRGLRRVGTGRGRSNMEGWALHQTEAAVIAVC